MTKYHAIPCQVGNDKYRSHRERDRHQDLLLLQRVGKIIGLCREVPFLLVPSKRRSDGKIKQGCTYLADYVYTDISFGKIIVEDAKGVRTKDYIIKRKLMLFVHGIEITET